MTDFIPNVFILESLERKDEEQHRFEGKIISDILRMSKKECKYYYVRTIQEVQHFLGEFQDSDYRYLHISCHANETSLSTTWDPLPFKEFGRMVRPYLENKRLFVSACRAVHTALADEVFKKHSGCYSLIGPRDDILFSDAAAMWATFYHLMLGEDRDTMNRALLIPVLNKIRNTYGVWLRYYARSDKNPKGYSKVEWRSVR